MPFLKRSHKAKNEKGPGIAKFRQYRQYRFFDKKSKAWSVRETQ